MKFYKIKILLLLVFSIQILSAQSNQDVIEAKIINFQKDIVGKLTGHIPIKGKRKLKSRASASERRITADYLMDNLKDIGLDPKRNTYNVQDKTGKQYLGSNIYATIPATNDSDEYIVLGAHYDTAVGSPGAVHNATGIALTQYVADGLIKLQNRNINFLIVFF